MSKRAKKEKTFSLSGGGNFTLLDAPPRTVLKNNIDFKITYGAQNPPSSAPIYLPALSYVAQKNSEAWFRSWADRWTKETGHLASLSARKKHFAYRRIVELREAAIPFLIGELQNNSDFWFSALRDITGEDPVKEQIRGKFDEMCTAWIIWAKNKGIKPVHARRTVP